MEVGQEGMMPYQAVSSGTYQGQAVRSALQDRVVGFFLCLSSSCQLEAWSQDHSSLLTRPGKYQRLSLDNPGWFVTLQLPMNIIYVPSFYCRNVHRLKFACILSFLRGFLLTIAYWCL